LYVKSGVKIEKLIGGGEQERGLRGGTVNVPAVVGIAKAYKKACEQMQENEQKMQALIGRFLDGVKDVSGITVNGDGERIASVLNLRLQGVENTAFLYNMDLNGVCLSAGSAGASASVKPSHVLTAMGLDEKQAKECVRFSFGKNNTQDEIDEVVKLTKQTVEKLRGFNL
jgi:cysteine desulfurase